jgi:ribonuclease HI
MTKHSSLHDSQPIVIFSDGACSGNPGPGGWGSIIITPDDHVQELGGGNPQTTNNQMEMTAALEALRFVENIPGEVIVYTDSVYVIRGITQWIWGWIRNGWRTSSGGEVQNQDIWQALAAIVAKRKKPNQITWKYIRGHTGNAGNERCDEIAVAYSKRSPIQLYKGTADLYLFSRFDLPPDQPIPETKPRQAGSTSKAHSYVSLLGSTPMRHSTWAECERRVKGQPGAKFKKAQSADDESTILRSWGVDPKSLK